jgi:O-antigen ligase
VGAFVLERISTRRPLVHWHRELTVAACLFAWAALTVPLSLWPGGSVSTLIEVYLKSLVVFWLVSHVLDTEARLRIAATALSLLSLPLSLTAIENFRTGTYIGDERIAGYTGPLTGNPNDLALMLNLLIPMSIALLLDAKGGVARLFFGAIAIISAIAVVTTYSRSGFITLSFIAFIYVWKMIRRRFHGTALLCLVFAVLIACMAPTNYVDRISTIAAPEHDPTGSAQARWSDMHYAMTSVFENPLVGSGIGNNALALNLVRGEHWLEVHNVYLVYAVELGVPGALLFIMLMVFALRTAAGAETAARQKSGPCSLSRVADATFISLLAFALSAMFYPAAYHFYFYMFAGLAIAARSIASERA